MSSKKLADYQGEAGGSFRDTLTGVFTHGFFQVFLEREIKRAQRSGKPFSLALVDIDWFSGFNRRYGHARGDRLLREVASLIQASIRESDLAARYANDVFGVIFAETGAQQSLNALERIRSGMEAYPEGDLTVSIGLVSFPRDAEDKEALLQRAQRALREAKLRGKNRVFCFEVEQRLPDDSRARVLIVDDSSLNLKMLEGLLRPLDYEVLKAESGERALDIAGKVECDVVLLDVMMPGMDGFEVCRRLKENEATRMVPVILVTALDDVESKVKGIESGADDFITKPPNKLELLARTKSLVRLKRLNGSLTSIENVLFSLAKTVEAKDLYTQGHVERVAGLAVTLGGALGLGSGEMEALRFGGMLHDIGKIGMPDTILNKPGALDADEWRVMRGHPETGYRICLPLERTLGPALEVIRHHHEKLDGSGYPDGLQGGEISMVARVMAVADIFDALVTDRPYRRGMPQTKALAILQEECQSGKLDSRVVAELIQILGKQKTRPGDPQPYDRPETAGSPDPSGGGDRFLEKPDAASLHTVPMGK